MIRGDFNFLYVETFQLFNFKHFEKKNYEKMTILRLGY